MATETEKPEQKMLDVESLIEPLSERFDNFLADKSCFQGFADSISFPQSSDEVSQLIKHLFAEKIPVTVQGARTGLTGAAVPQGGHIMSTVNMNNILGLRQNHAGEIFVHVEPGLTLKELNSAISSNFSSIGQLDDESQEVLNGGVNLSDYFWPPDLSEESATIGGIASTNGLGINAFKYGRASQYIEGIRFVGGLGNDYWISRPKFSPEQGPIENDFVKSLLPETENASSLDLILGGEGMYGVITELSLKLLPKPKLQWGMVVFLQNDEHVFTFIDKCQSSLTHEDKALIGTIEFLDERTLTAVKTIGPNLAGFQHMPAIPELQKGAVYIELHGESIQDLKPLVAKQQACLESLGIDTNLTWAASDEAELRRIRLLRSFAPRVANMLVDMNRKRCPQITQLFTDIQFDGSFSSVLSEYQRDLEDTRMPATIFGQAMENHLHVNLFPEDEKQLAIAKRLLVHWAQRVKIQGGELLGKHGVGKLKINDSYQELSKEMRDKDARLKEIFDAQGLFNPGNRQL